MELKAETGEFNKHCAIRLTLLKTKIISKNDNFQNYFYFLSADNKVALNELTLQFEKKNKFEEFVYAPTVAVIMLLFDFGHERVFPASKGFPVSSCTAPRLS